MSCLVVGMFDNLVGPLSFDNLVGLILVTFSFCRRCLLYFGFSMKRGHAFPLSHITYCNWCLLSSFQTKHFLLIQCFRLMLMLFNFDLFLNLVFYYI